MATTYGTADLNRNTAVQDVSGTGPNGETTTKAQVVALAASGGGSDASFVTEGPPYNASPTDGSGTITSGGVSQTLFAANTSRKGFRVQNQSAADLYVRQSASAAAANNTSVRVPPGMVFVADFITGTAVQIFGATTGQAFEAKSW